MFRVLIRTLPRFSLISAAFVVTGIKGVPKDETSFFSMLISCINYELCSNIILYHYCTVEKSPPLAPLTVIWFKTLLLSVKSAAACFALSWKGCVSEININ
jgi:hypothetical protein